MTPTLAGYSLRLEPLTLEHLPRLELASRDPDTFTYFSENGGTAHGLREMVLGALRQSEMGTTEVWATVLLTGSEPRVIGSTRFADIHHQHRTCELGWTWLAAPYRGIGINPRVKLLQLTYAFEALHLRRVALKTHHANVRSQRAMLKLGAQYEGTFRNHMLMPDGSSRDTKYYSIIDSDWPTVKAGLLERIDSTKGISVPEVEIHAAP